MIVKTLMSNDKWKNDNNKIKSDTRIKNDDKAGNDNKWTTTGKPIYQNRTEAINYNITAEWKTLINGNKKWEKR